MRPLLVVLRRFLKEKRLAMALGFLLAALTAIAGIALLSLSGWFITATAFAGLTTATALAFDVFAPSAGIRFLALFRTAARYGERVVTHDATLSVLAGMRETLFRTFATARSARALALRPARLLFRLTLDVDALDGLYLRLLVPAGVALASALFAVLSLAFIDGRIALAVGLFPVVAGFGIATISALKAEKPARLRAAALEAVRGRVIDMIAGATDLLMAGRLEASRANVEAAETRLAETDDRLNRIETMAGFGLSALAPVIGGCLLVALALLVETDVIGVPIAAFALLLALAAVEPFTALKRGALEAGRILAAARRIAPRLDETPQEIAIAAPPPGLALLAENIVVRHPGASRPALSGLSLAIPAGEIVALTGPSGAGKSTLMALIAGEIEAEAGRFATQPASLLTQHVELFADTLSGNLRLAKPQATEAELWAALEAAGLAETVKALPQGLETWLGEGGSGLSGGERRRLSLARLLLTDAALLLLDEPTEALDAETARDIVARLAAARGGRTILIATHSLREVEISDRILVVDNGQLRGNFNCMESAFTEVASGLRKR
ncbi:thiol reductant ABC exporter subunit CydC [Rhizobium sp. S95]|uniref:Thiol reductant ABC exporter subunit CydC n=1 Tax=Ciceribacter sichuanensis TaxID=2949647 RepID=A0AAJ1BYP5_9HYPH|nr:MULTISPECIES: thiol reductant ABC exporter subunit CydC [unclassified Ciceribacter]MCM2394664.1 thiol reductant ABC exporter subunit CydC [Ciceribacter sp. S95]MCO5958629.1 thiol reductant ABC exporter subunit CydC [Ciceribacter sp. S101]